MLGSHSADNTLESEDPKRYTPSPEVDSQQTGSVYFAMKWFRSEMRFLVTSLLLLASTLFPSQILTLLLKRRDGPCALFPSNVMAVFF